ncbi:cytochrome c biogenesis CcdA family protein [Nonomuraea sp. NPDC050790]|uniref:cytochrome c biogenesis CcdA family protein n=1 Tax=Nonomuraea sp. NPDC050790 TaxID=3364371 RepID=UPI00378DB4DE
MTEIGYAAAFLGGLFSLVSPCGAMLLPAFFAYAFPSGRALAGRTALFYAGLCAVLVPLGMGSALVSRVFYGHRELLVTVAGWALVAFGVLQIAGQGWTLGPVERLRARLRGDSAWTVLGLGAVSGLAGFCAGPILGAVLTVAAASGDAVRGAVLLAVYAAGMAAPLLLLALLWERYDLGRRRWLRGRGVELGPVRIGGLRLGPVRLHTTSTLSGLVFVTLGVVFLVTDGTAALAGAVPEDLEDRIGAWAAGVPDLALVGAGAVALVAATVWGLARAGKQRSGPG